MSIIIPCSSTSNSFSKRSQRFCSQRVRISPMNLERKSILFAFLATLCFTLLMPVLLPNWRLMFFAPFLVILYYRKSYLVCLWSSLLCGLAFDLLVLDTRIGFHAIAYCLTTWILYGQRRNFFADSISTLPLMTFFFSFIATAIQTTLLYIFEQRAELSWRWAFTDLICMPACDALFAFTWFILPAVCFGSRPKRGSDYFMNRSSNG